MFSLSYSTIFLTTNEIKKRRRHISKKWRLESFFQFVIIQILICIVIRPRPNWPVQSETCRTWPKSGPVVRNLWMKNQPANNPLEPPVLHRTGISTLDWPDRFLSNHVSLAFPHRFLPVSFPTPSPHNF